MDWALRKIAIRQMEKKTKAFADFVQPGKGWIKTMREVLGMNIRQLAEKIEVSSERVVRIESDELNNKLTMATLQKVASAMNCRFVYAFVPNENLDKFLEKTAKEKATAQMLKISHSMALEDQEVKSKELKEQINILAEEYLRGDIKKIWDK